jgi:hypothetical protein
MFVNGCERTLIIFHFLIILLINILFIIIFNNLDKANFKLVEDIGDNWKLGPITDLVIRNGKCLIGEQNLLSNNFWPGTVDGCDCSNLEDLKDVPLKNGLCDQSSGSINSHCTNVKAKAQISYQKWRGKSFCGHRLTNHYLDFFIALNKDECEYNQRSCGILDTKQNHLCLDKNIECPINLFHIQKKSSKLPENFKPLKLIKLEIDKDTEIYISKDNFGGEILNEIIVSEHTPCIDNDYHNLPNHQYILSTIYDKTVCPPLDNGKSVDSRLRLIDTENLNNFYTSNDIIGAMNDLPLHQKYSDVNSISLYVKNYFGLNYYCKQEFGSYYGRIDYLKQLSRGSLNPYIKDLKNYSIISIMIGFSAIVIFLFLIAKIINRTKNLGYITISLFEVLGFLITSICVLFINGIIAAKMQHIPHDYHILTKKFCGDSISSEIFEMFSNSFGVASSISVGNCVFLGLLVVYPFLYFMFDIYDKYPDEEVNKCKLNKNNINMSNNALNETNKERYALLDSRC